MYVLETKNDQRPGKTHFGRRQLACSSSSTASTLLIILVLPGYGNEIEDLNSQWEGECSQQSWKFGGLSYLQLFQQCHCKTRTDSVRKVCGGIWRGFDHLTKLEISKVEVVQLPISTKKRFNFIIIEVKNGKSWPNVTANTFLSDLKCFLGQKWHSKFK